MKVTRLGPVTMAALLMAATAWPTIGAAQPAASAGPLPVIADIVAKPEGAATLRAALAQAAATARTETGCISYRLYEDREHPGHFMTYEMWTGDAALNAHLSSTAMRAGLAKLGPLLAQPPVITRLKPLP